MYRFQVSFFFLAKMSVFMILAFTYLLLHKRRQSIEVELLQYYFIAWSCILKDVQELHVKGH